MKKIPVPLIVEDGAKLPHYATDGAAGADLKAHIKEEIVILPGERKLISTGLRAAIPEGYEIQVRPRSGLALKHGVTVLNTPGTIDADYRGVIGVILINHGDEPFTVTPGMRIAQAVIASVIQAEFEEVHELTESVRGTGGFGHSGTH